MSVVAKILVVLNLVLAIAFLGASATFLGVKDSWKLRYETDIPKKDEEIATLTENLNGVSKKYNDQRDLTNQKDTELQTAKSSIAAKEVEYAKVDEAYNRLKASYESLEETSKKLQGTIDRLTAEKDALIKQKDDAVSDMQGAKDEMNTAVTEQHRLQAQIDDLDGQIAELEKRLNAAGDEIEKKDLILAAYRDKYGEVPEWISMPPITAKVTNVSDEFNIVMLSVGTDDNVKVGYEFTIFRGAEYVGKVVINKVEKDYCAGYSKKEVERDVIQAGDDAKTRF
jgi:predicted nuclease with TOPRIM domain